MTVVSDAGPIIHASWIAQLHLLQNLFGEVLVPPAVESELLRATPDTRGLVEVQAAFAAGWLVRVGVSNASDTIERDAGEREAIELAVQENSDWFLSDDLQARREAMQRGLRVMGTVGILTRARVTGLIPSALALVLELDAMGQWLDPDLIQYVRESEQR